MPLTLIQARPHGKPPVVGHQVSEAAYGKGKGKGGKGGKAPSKGGGKR